MLQYLIVLLDKASVSFCHYDAPKDICKDEGTLMPLDTLRKGIVFAMKENLNIQFVYPERPLPPEYNEVVESIDHTKIKPESQADEADVIVLTKWGAQVAAEGATCIIRTSRKELREHIDRVKDILGKAARLNIVLADVESFDDKDIREYADILEELSDAILEEWKRSHSVQLNLLTDRMQLREMNNCGAGDMSITLAPNGKFYLCPAFYYDDEKQSVGDLSTGLDIKNRQLLRLDHAPICRHCDAYQCKRCVWINSKLTLDINTPSHQQCVMAHVERNTSCALMHRLNAESIRLQVSNNIPEIDYLDPFINYKQWK